MIQCWLFTNYDALTATLGSQCKVLTSIRPTKSGDRSNAYYSGARSARWENEKVLCQTKRKGPKAMKKEKEELGATRVHSGSRESCSNSSGHSGRVGYVVLAIKAFQARIWLTRRGARSKESTLAVHYSFSSLSFDDFFSARLNCS